MLLAQNKNGVIIKPLKGGEAYCSECKELLIAKCGEQKTWHWSHLKDSNCLGVQTKINVITKSLKELIESNSETNSWNNRSEWMKDIF